MTSKVLFVHGTGVRKDAYLVTCEEISRQLVLHGLDVSLQTCLWGDTQGARLSMGGVSIPEFNLQTKTPPSDKQRVGLWGLLDRDPLFELRAMTPPGEDDDSPSVTVQRERILAGIYSLRTNAARSLTAYLQTYVCVAEWDKVVLTVSESEELQDAVEATHGAFGALRAAVARAIIATVQHDLTERNRPSLPRATRDKAVQMCQDLLGGMDMGGMSDWFFKYGEAAFKRLASFLALRNRDLVLSNTAPFAGDIMLYQARGEAIRDFIEKRITECGEDIIVLAHSLGGIACVELLIEKKLPQVKALVTVGSQAPFLYEINALRKLKAGDALPDHFPKSWMNFYDCNDLLSYRAGTVFKDRAEDVKIESDLPFPASHGGYWEHPDFWLHFQRLLK